MRAALAALAAVVLLATEVQAGERDAKLREDLGGATRIRVRSGGVCHRDRASETTLFEAAAPTAVAELLSGIAIDDAASGGHCMCCGEPTIELYGAQSGETLLGVIAVHHGRSIRWAGGKWVGDGVLTQESATFLSQWLTARGISGPAEELDEARRRAEAARARQRAYDAVARNGLTVAEDALTCFRLLGCHAGPWNLTDPIETAALEALGKTEANDIAAAIGRIGDDAAALRGAARWVLGTEGWRKLDRGALDAVLPKLARAGLSHPQKIARRRTIHALGKIRGDAARAALQRVIDDRVAVLPLPEAERVSPEGMIEFRPEDPGPDDATTDADAARAALEAMK